MLERLNMKLRLDEKEYRKQLALVQDQLRDLHFQIYRAQIPVLCVFEGWDAAGKGGAIKRVAEALDPRGFTVETFAAPKGEERTHHYLWRFWTRMPRAGHLSIFDRSHYGRVLVERVEGFCSTPEWTRAYREINEFEAQQTAFGMVICKFWLHITPAEQLRRFKKRERDPYRAYKLTEEDWRNRAKWNEYSGAVEEMFERTSTSSAPWTVVEANDKFYARLKIARTLSRAMSRAMKNAL
jgi:polyphosphate kinase 2 (PPK2 family)